MDVVFSFTSLDNAEPFDQHWDRYDAEKICGEMKSTVEGKLGPFGLITLAAEDLEEYTPVFFRIFKDNDKHLVLLCSDASMYDTVNRACLRMSLVFPPFLITMVVAGPRKGTPRRR